MVDQYWSVLIAKAHSRWFIKNVYLRWWGFVDVLGTFFDYLHYKTSSTIDLFYLYISIL